jgi:hypothetical protein
VQATVQGLDQLGRALRSWPKQTRFAAAQALNDVARDVQQFTVAQLLPEKFTLRSKGAPWFKPGTRLGFNITFATADNPVAIIGSRADWLRLHEEGGTKQAGGHRLAIPTTRYKPKAAIMQAAMKPRAILAASQARAAANKATDAMAAAHRRYYAAFAAEATAHNEGRRREAKALRERKHKALAAYQRSARKARKAATVAANLEASARALLANAPFLYSGSKMPAGVYVRRGKERLPLVKLFSFKTGARISPALEFGRRGKEVINRTHARHFAARLTRALLTAK